MTFVGLDILMGLETPKLIVPTEFKVWSWLANCTKSCILVKDYYWCTILIIFNAHDFHLYESIKSGFWLQFKIVRTKSHVWKHGIALMSGSKKQNKNRLVFLNYLFKTQLTLFLTCIYLCHDSPLGQIVVGLSCPLERTPGGCIWLVLCLLFLLPSLFSWISRSLLLLSTARRTNSRYIIVKVILLNKLMKCYTVFVDKILTKTCVFVFNATDHQFCTYIIFWP